MASIFNIAGDVEKLVADQQEANQLTRQLIGVANENAANIEQVGEKLDRLNDATGHIVDALDHVVGSLNIVVKFISKFVGPPAPGLISFRRIDGMAKNYEVALKKFKPVKGFSDAVRGELTVSIDGGTPVVIVTAPDQEAAGSFSLDVGQTAEASYVFVDAAGAKSDASTTSFMVEAGHPPTPGAISFREVVETPTPAGPTEPEPIPEPAPAV